MAFLLAKISNVPFNILESRQYKDRTPTHLSLTALLGTEVTFHTLKAQRKGICEFTHYAKFVLCRYDYVLEAVVTYTTDMAMQEARAADALLAQGTYLGPLHGIPYGLKDIIAVNGYPTTWGAPQFRNQYIEENSNVFLR